MDRSTFDEWFRELRAIDSATVRQERVSFVKNAGGNQETGQITASLIMIRTSLKRFTANVQIQCSILKTFFIRKAKRINMDGNMGNGEEDSYLEP